MAPLTAAGLVGRAREREELAGALAAVRFGQGGVIVIDGEPGIDKTRLLLELAQLASGEDCVVLGARASEFERDLPYALWSEAVEGHLSALGARRVELLGIADLPALAGVAPVLSGESTDAARADRHRTHAALRDLLERLAATRALLICLDDVHWADPASVDALAALVRRPPSAPVLVALAAREGQLPLALARAVAAAMAEDRATRIELRPLNQAEAEQLIGADVAAIFALSGGNPFYLQQLARVRAQPRGHGLSAEGLVPAAVAASLASELGELAPGARLLIEAAAVLGDPFEPDVAAEVAELEQATALGALDELLARALLRPAGAPRRFAFRHPLVRRAVYESSPSGWRLAAHARAADALARRGAGVVARAHHVEHAAHAGDETAITLLAAAADGLHAAAPAAAAGFYRASLRLMPDAPETHAERARIEGALADAQAAAGDAVGARETLLKALSRAEGTERLALTVRVANVERWLGRNEEARRRVQVALGDLPAQASADRIRLRLALGVTPLFVCDLADARAQASDARYDARTIGDRVFESSALALTAIAVASGPAATVASEDVEQAAAAIDALSEAQQVTRLPAFWMIGRARRALGDFEQALEIIQRGARLARQTGRESALLLLAVESVPALVELGRLREADAAAQTGLELARLAGNAPQLLCAQCAMAGARLAAGDVAAAVRHAEQAAQDGTLPDFHATGQPGWALGAALAAAGDPQQGVHVMLESLGGPHLTRVLPAERPAAAADLVDVLLAGGRPREAADALASGETAAAQIGTDWAAHDHRSRGQPCCSHKAGRGPPPKRPPR